MEFHETDLPGVHVLLQQRHEDGRGWFARSWCARELAAAGLDARLAQVNLSRTERRGTVRGMHLQDPPHAESKLVSVLQGAILDVAVDAREGSPTRWRHVAVELSATNGRALFVPMGFAHGFQALTDDVVMMYAMSDYYHPAAERGFRHDDPVIGIDWPLPVVGVSAKDAGHAWIQAPAADPADPADPAAPSGQYEEGHDGT